MNTPSPAIGPGSHVMSQLQTWHGAFASKLVIMDEPTAALGVQETAQVENIIRGLKDRGIPMILISHNLRQVFDLVDRIVVFRRGRIVASLRKDETDGNDIVS